MKFSTKNKIERRGFSHSISAINKWVAVLAVALLPFISFTVSGAEKAGKGKDLSMRTVFANLYTPGLELLGKSARLDMADYWEADSVRKVYGALDGAAWLEAMTENYLKVRVSPVSTVELKLLPYRNGRIVACVYTVGDSVQARDSEVYFYDSELRPLDKKKFFRAPGLEDFFKFPKDAQSEYAEVREAVPFPTVAYSLSPDNNNLEARLTVEDYISPDDVALVRKYMLPDLVTPWRGKYKF